MLPGFSGSLVTEYFAEEFLVETFGDEIDARGADLARGPLARRRLEAHARLGPVCVPRLVYDLVSAPLAEALGYRLSSLRPAAHGRALLASTSEAGPLLLTTAWGEPLDSYTREAARAALAACTSWCVCCNGTEVRLVDARRLYARRFAQFDLHAALGTPTTFRVLWALLRASSFLPRTTGESPATAFIERVAEASDRNTVGVCRSLRDGVLQALALLLAGFLRARRSRRDPSAPLLSSIHEQSLTIVYRILFLLFAESRRLVPTWHPVYRDGYSLQSLLALAEQPREAAGIWETVQAISRLSHAGCHAGNLRVTPFNGRLFSPSITPLAERQRLDDGNAREMVLALATTPRRGGRARIAYRDLDVEQLGAVYESVLDYAPVARRRAAARGLAAVELLAGSGARKATSSFYTPRALTTYLVRRTLAPLVADATPEQILALRVVDPAMGSGAFLVAACRMLAAEYASALVRAGRCLASDIDEEDRRGFRRAIAQRCLYGVDLNPMAVQLARLSLWLATLAPDRPLTFLDHRLMAGNSLVGASIDEVLRQPGRTRGGPREPGAAELRLFGPDNLQPVLQAVLPTRAAMAERADDTIAAVREKERMAAAAAARDAPLAAWKSVLDAWCAGLLASDGNRSLPGVFFALADHLLGNRSALGAATASRCLQELQPAVKDVRPFHWTLEFPEIFYGPDGRPVERPGFDAVIGNPPWDMLRADNPGAPPSGTGRAASLMRFVRGSGIYRARGEGHQNAFQLFVERALHLVREEGRVGLVVPWGLLSDQGCAPLRRLLFDRATLDPVVGFDNADRIFPIHRSVRFLALSATAAGSTRELRARLGERTPSFLDQLPSAGEERAHFPLVLSRPLLDRVSGPGLAVPDVRRAEDIALLERLSRAAPALSDPAGWGAAFGRELNASDDRPHMVPAGGGLPVLEGKHIEPFRALPAASNLAIPHGAASRLLDAGRTFQRPRLAYRDVSSATNRLTLIAAIVPAGCVTVHSLFCLRTPLPLRQQLFLAAIMNSLVANYFVRFWVSSHVTTAIIGRLPVPRPPANSAAFRGVAALSAALSLAPSPLTHPAYPRLQARVARLYGLDAEELARILETFPLIDDETKGTTRREFDAMTCHF